MEKTVQPQELYHEVFGSILDRKEMTPYLLKNCDGYASALRQSSLMMANRGFDVLQNDLASGEKERAQKYVRQAQMYFSNFLLPAVKRQLHLLSGIDSPQKELYISLISSIENLECLLSDKELSALIDEDPRHLFLLASSAKYSGLFDGYKGSSLAVPPQWQKRGCFTLKMCHLIKAIEEDSQDVNDYAQLGFFLKSKRKELFDLFSFNWDNPAMIPDEESARRAFVKLSTFFKKINSSMSYDKQKGFYIFNSGDGVQVDIIEVKARLKSPESMFTKLGKNVEGEAYNIRDILAITFLLRSREDSLLLFHALQKRGVILQENTVSQSITQTLFSCPEDMTEAVRRLMSNIALSEGSSSSFSEDDVRGNTIQFFNALSINAVNNPYSSDGHRKFQCKINYSLPIHRERMTHRIILSGINACEECLETEIITQQHTLPVEIRISDCQSWEESEQKGESHHEAYKSRQLIYLMNRLFDPVFSFPADAFTQLRKDQNRLYS